METRANPSRMVRSVRNKVCRSQRVNDLSLVTSVFIVNKQTKRTFDRMEFRSPWWRWFDCAETDGWLATWPFRGVKDKREETELRSRAENSASRGVSQGGCRAEPREKRNWTRCEIGETAGHSMPSETRGAATGVYVSRLRGCHWRLASADNGNPIFRNNICLEDRRLPCLSLSLWPSCRMLRTVDSTLWKETLTLLSVKREKKFLFGTIVDYQTNIYPRSHSSVNWIFPHSHNRQTCLFARAFPSVVIKCAKRIREPVG